MARPSRCLETGGEKGCRIFPGLRGNAGAVVFDGQSAEAVGLQDIGWIWPSAKQRPEH